MRDHFSVMVQIKRVTKAEDTINRSLVGSTQVEGKRVVEDVVVIVTNAEDPRAAIMKAMKLLDVELKDHDVPAPVLASATTDPEGWDA